MARDFKKLVLIFILFLLFSVFAAANAVFADIYSSSNYQILDPVIDIGGGRSTSASFDLLQSFGQYMLGTTTSGTFTMQSGFLAYPVASSPILSATAGDGSASLSWTASEAYVGWTVGGYDVGVSTISGGPYTYESAGDVLIYAKSGLTNGTPYYFKIKTKDSLGYQIALSNEANATPAGTVTPPTPPSGGGGGILPQPRAQAIFSGIAYPSSLVTLLSDGTIEAVAMADSAGNFRIALSNLSTGSYVFTIYAKDRMGLKSSNVVIRRDVEEGKPLDITGIFIPPTLAGDKIKVKQGDPINFFGQTAANSRVFITIEPGGYVAEKSADANGNYSFTFDTTSFEYGPYTALARAVLASGLASDFSYPFGFSVSTETVPVQPQVCPPYGDFNDDCRVNLIDFSILMYWFFRPDVPAKVDINGNGRADLTDFSVMAYYWTG